MSVAHDQWQAVDEGRAVEAGSGVHLASEDALILPDTPVRRNRLADALEAERERFFLWAPVALGCGIAAYFSLPAEPPFAAAAALLVIAIIIRRLSTGGTLVATFAMTLVLMATGFAVAKLRVENLRAPMLVKPLYNAELTGWVTYAETRSPAGQRLTIVVENLAKLDQPFWPKRVRVSTLSKKAETFRPGDRLRLTANLSPPSWPVLPGGYDFARTAWFKQIGGQGYTFKEPERLGRIEAPDLFWQIHFRIQDLRQTIAERVHAALPEEAAGTALALITGDRGGISEETNEAYRGSGLFHILSISGLHMVVMAGTVFFLVRIVLACFPAVALSVSIKKVAALAGMFAALGYLAVSGMEYATVRATLMMLVAFTAILADRPALALRNVALSALIILLLFPDSLFNAGFQMSFAAVTALVAAFEEVRRRRLFTVKSNVARAVMFFTGIVFTTVVATAAVAPFAAHHFHQSQSYGLLANLLAIPICNFVVMPSVLATFLLMPFGLEAAALWALGLGIDGMTWCATWVSSLPGAVTRIPATATLAFVLVVAGGLWLMLWRRTMRLAGLLAIAAGLFLVPLPERPDILVGRDGKLVAIRLPDGKLSALPARRAGFQLSHWLESDGDARGPRAAQQAKGFRCDALGCIATVAGAELRVPLHPAAFRDDCATREQTQQRRLHIIAFRQPKPDGCRNVEHTIDLFDIWREGTHAIYLTRDSEQARPAIRIETVGQYRGQRPWTGEELRAELREHEKKTRRPEGSAQ